MQKNMTSSQVHRKRRAEAAVEAATVSSERVTTRAKSISQSIAGRVERKTNPFNLVDFDEEDSLVASIENVIATSNAQCATSSEISGEQKKNPEDRKSSPVVTK